MTWKNVFNNGTYRITHPPHGIRLDTIPTKLLTTALTTCSKIWYTGKRERVKFIMHGSARTGMWDVVLYSPLMYTADACGLTLAKSLVGCTAV